MIGETKFRGYSVCYKNNDPRYLEILNDILSCNVQNIRVSLVFKSLPHTHVSLIETKYGQFVFKVYSPKKKIVEKFLKSLVTTNPNENLIKKIDCARTRGHVFPNDFYLLAERRILRFAKVSIMLFEYIPGPLLCEIPSITEDVKHDIESQLREMHAKKIISGDAHERNFILSGEGVRIIDLSGKRCCTRRIVEDNVTVNLRIGVPIEPRNFWEGFLIAKKIRRHNKIKQRKLHYN